MIFDSLRSNNQYPIVFLGSGISKRYLANSPSWLDLLEQLWDQVFAGSSADFYGQLSLLKDDFIQKGLSPTEANFNANTHIATIIEHQFNENFRRGIIKLDTLSTKEAYQNNTSPFKHFISKQLEYSRNIKDGFEDELISFGKLLSKAQMIVTTNYDTFIEYAYEKATRSAPKVYIGQEGFFDDTTGWSELFKIHGCVTRSNSIVITEDDYDKYNNNSILISARLLVSLTNSPIIFIGYSLSDINVRKVIRDFYSQLPKNDPRLSSEKIILVEYTPNVHDIQESIIRDPDIGNYTLLQTDNFKIIYDQLSEIDQGIPPYEVMKFQKSIRKLIAVKGVKKELDTLLVDLDDLRTIDDAIQDNIPLVVAIGDKKHIYFMPDPLDYIYNYVLGTGHALGPQLALKFISSQPTTAQFPYARYIKAIRENVGLYKFTSSEKKRIQKKISATKTLSEILTQVSSKSTDISVHSIDSIWSNKAYQWQSKINTIISNICNFDRQELKIFIENQALNLFRDVFPSTDPTKSQLRKLFLAYDQLIYGDINSPDNIDLFK